MSEIKVGDKVRFNNSKAGTAALNYRRQSGYPTIHGGDEFVVTNVFERKLWDLKDTIRIAGSGLKDYTECWGADVFDKVEPQQTAVAKLLNTNAKLYPQDKTVLTHLQNGKAITPMKALTIYGFSRLAAQIHNIRKAGYKVACAVREDERGHKYAEYTLAA